MFLCSTVDTVQNANNCINTTDDGVILIYKRCKFPLQYAFYLLDHIRRSTIHSCNTFCNISLFFRWQSSQYLGRLCRSQIRKDHRNRLRMFILYKVQQLCRICLSDKFERTNLERCCKFCNNSLCLVVSECFFQKFFCVSDTAFRNILLCEAYLIKLFQHFLLGLWRYASCIRYFQR